MILNDYRKSGIYYAMIIGINDYEEWNQLKTAVNDAVTLKEILVRRYNFSEANILHGTFMFPVFGISQMLSFIFLTSIFSVGSIFFHLSFRIIFLFLKLCVH